MGVSRKPVPYPVTPAGEAGPGGPSALRRQDSWEVYSDEEDGPEILSNDDTQKPTAGQPKYTPYRPGADNIQPQPSGNAYATPAQPPQGADSTSGAGRLDQIPDSLRPGGPQGQTNPFLRNKASQNMNAPPTDQLAALNVGEPASKPWQPPQTQKTGSSNYDTPPATVVSDTNPWLDTGERSYSPVSEAIAFPQEGPGTVAKASYSHSPINMEVDPWDPTPTSAPRVPQSQQPPPQPQTQPLTSQLTGNNPWASSVDGTASTTPTKPPPVPSMTPSPQPSSNLAPPVYDPPPVPQSSPGPVTPEPSANMAAPIPLAPSAPPPSSTPTTLPALTPSPQPPSSSYGDNNPFASQNRASPNPPASQSHSPAPPPAQLDNGSGFFDAPQNQTNQAPQLPPLVALDDDNNNGSGSAAPDFWEDLGSQTTQDKGKEKAAASQIEEWNLVDAGEASGAPGSSSFGESNSEQQPALPPRPSGGENSQWLSPRTPIDAKTETYPVKKIKWHDAESPQNPRVSPILVQNANGPCPLVALVNALSLTTPPNVDESSLVEVLRSREQISLNLLLDAVFEELMSPRRMSPDMSLPDVGDLYAFLMSLHTGMNVNPRFMPTNAMREAYEHTSLTQLNPSERANIIPGTFENTHEMHLYATFKIPLIHGWLPPTSDPAYSALERQAPSYEDAQNLLFREEELDRKLSSPDGLTREEQELYQDVVTIKGFLESSATQLTAWGIQVISKAIRPGTFAILFRNDHFSTLYCHPQSKELVTLVTDEGYRSHDDVVWESLVDINGERTQYLSGDFKVVGSGESSTSGAYSAQGGEWTTVQNNRRGKDREQPESDAGEEAPMSAIEQEDRDLALAMQLQEEEDQRHRDEEARRQREREQNLSNQYIEQQGRTPYGNTGSGTRASNGIAPARRNSNNISMYSASPSMTGSQRYSQPQQQQQQQQSQPQQPQRPPAQQVRPLVPPRRNVPPTHRPDASAADAPPPYEQAGQDQLFEPPVGHPNHAAASTSDVSRQTTNASGTAPAAAVPRPNGRPQFTNFSSSQGPQGGRYPGQVGPGGRLHAANSGVPGRDRDRDCVVM